MLLLHVSLLSYSLFNNRHRCVRLIPSSFARLCFIAFCHGQASLGIFAVDDLHAPYAFFLCIAQIKIAGELLAASGVIDIDLAFRQVPMPEYSLQNSVIPGHCLSMHSLQIFLRFIGYAAIYFKLYFCCSPSLKTPSAAGYPPGVTQWRNCEEHRAQAVKQILPEFSLCDFSVCII